jgi:hypothetical protein
LDYAYGFVRTCFNFYVMTRKLHYQTADSALTDRANGNAILIFLESMKGSCKSVKVVKTLYYAKASSNDSLGDGIPFSFLRLC